MAETPDAANPDAQHETLEEFVAKLQRIAEDWRYSNEFIGLVVRTRWPRDYSRLCG